MDASHCKPSEVLASHGQKESQVSTSFQLPITSDSVRPELKGRRAFTRNVSFQISLRGPNYLINQLINPNFRVAGPYDPTADQTVQRSSSWFNFNGVGTTLFIKDLPDSWSSCYDCRWIIACIHHIVLADFKASFASF